MLTGRRRRFVLPIGLAAAIVFIYLTLRALLLLFPAPPPTPRSYHQRHPLGPGVADDPEYLWRRVPTHYPVPPESLRPLPDRPPRRLPNVQTRSFPAESTPERAFRLARRDAVRRAFERCWSSYARRALPADELAPLTGGAGGGGFGGWGATLGT